MDIVFSQVAWLAPLFPLTAFAVLTAMGRGLGKAGAIVATAASLLSFVLALLIAAERLGDSAEDYTGRIEWLRAGGVVLHAGYEVTNLTALMLVIVTLVALLVNVYSLSYMKDDERISVFFAYVALFTASMLGLVLADNLLTLYVCWELVGVCSFLLIGFWFRKPEARAAAKKAFVVTRIGDLGLLIAILLLYWNMPNHALDYTSLYNVFHSQSEALSDSLTTLIALLIFLGAVGKSGQFPLHVWLPDAMEGPTPISALIHAATMVAAGVYLVARTFDVFEASPNALTVVALVGAFTAIFAAAIGLAQNDIKRVLAYSTVSQLGYMMLALGSGAAAAAMFHLFTHAFFKALLFLAAGSVIHAVHTQDIREMGGLGRRMKLTAWTFGIGALALSGVPPLSGFWSKDAVLAAALEKSPWLFAVAVVTALFTALYMARLFFLVFTGSSRGEAVVYVHAKESPAAMTVPLVILAVLTVAAGFVWTPWNEWLPGWLAGSGAGEEEAGAGGWNGVVVAASVAASLLGLLLGWLVYGRKGAAVSAAAAKAPGLVRILERKFYIDELYDIAFVRPLAVLGRALHVFDEVVVDGAVRLVGRSVQAAGKLNTRLLSGQLQTYGLAALAGAVILIVAIAGRRFW
ncbi:NADH-quinone oxidoreductase subunit L [Cohnella fermenti]|uniref:NADH-quinone oxidoreductase subunit L n=1 Tax=Cohnella fermenti TaxID=2565925 RepID=A0A4S4BHY6_9BACL|nr:NADH-quinone oxidoreductase subunit L [Cohnella fermenti]THF73143.1 NADH-quinone oxidoreductase subunit L [Cohnella fermenti]